MKTAESFLAELQMTKPVARKNSKKTNDNPIDNQEVKQAVEPVVNKKTNIENPVQIQRKGAKRVAAYIRVSSDSSDQENSYETQEHYFSNLLATNPSWISAGIYSDYGISGTSKEKRTGFKRLLRHCEERKIDRVVCKSVSRFARNTADFLKAINVLNEHNVSIYFEKEGIDTDQPTSSFALAAFAAFAQSESESISENQRMATDKRNQNGETPNVEIYGYRFTGKKIKLPSGYKLREIEIVESEAVIVRRIFKEVSEGKNFNEIATGLNRDGVLAPTTQKSHRTGLLKDEIYEGWTAGRVSRIAHSERYVGDVLTNKTYVDNSLTHKSNINKGEVPQYLIHNHHPAIVDRELYEKVTAILAPSTSSNPLPFKFEKLKQRERMLSGMLVCEHCGRNFNYREKNWYCPSTRLNNGKNICNAADMREDDVFLNIRLAFKERFGTKEDVLKMLEKIHADDFMETDRSYYAKLVIAANKGIERGKRQVNLIQSQLDAMMTRKELLDDEKITEELLNSKRDQLIKEQMKLEQSQKEADDLTQKFNDLENYWDALENTYEIRKESIAWLKTVSNEEEFFNGLQERYLKAFIFPITVYSKNHFKIRWMDNMETDLNRKEGAR